MRIKAKRFLAKSMMMLTVTGALVLNGLGITSLAGSAGGREYNIGNLDLSKATVKPTLTLSCEKLEASYARGTTVTITLTVGGADKKYAPTGIHIDYDSRLTLVSNEDDELATKGPAGSGLASEIQPDGSHGIFVATDASGDRGKDGVLWSFDFRIPTDAKGGDRYNIEIVYKTKPTAEDLFTNIAKDEVGELMQAYVFTQGITQGCIEIAAEDISATVNGYSGDYDGQPHGINVQVTDPASGATVRYKNSAGEYVLTESPAITDVADSPMTVDYRITADGYETKTGSATVTLLPVDPETPKDLTAVYGQTLSDVALPDGWTWADDSSYVGDYGENTFKASYTSSSANIKSVSDVDVSVSVDKAPSELTESPAANSLVYNGQDQALITEGEAVGGSFMYRLGEDGEWTDSVPEATAFDTYTVYYYIKGDDNHEDTGSESEPIGSVDVTIKCPYSNEWVDGKWYNKDGSQTYEYIGDWKKDGKGWMFADTSDWYAKNRWQKIDFKWYYFDREGHMLKDVYQKGADGRIWYIGKNGVWDGEAAVTGWTQDSEGWRFGLYGDDYLKNTWKMINGSWYYFKADGYAAQSEFVKGLWFNEKCIQSDPVKYSWHRTSKGWWYGVKDGWFAKNATYIIDGKSYTFDKKGYQK